MSLAVQTRQLPAYWRGRRGGGIWGWDWFGLVATTYSVSIFNILRRLLCICYACMRCGSTSGKRRRRMRGKGASVGHVPQDIQQPEPEQAKASSQAVKPCPPPLLRPGQMSHSQLWPIKRSLNVAVASGHVCEHKLMTWRMHLDTYRPLPYPSTHPPNTAGSYSGHIGAGHIINIKWRTKPR